VEQVKLKRWASRNVRNGYPMIIEQDVVKKPQSEEGDLVELVDSEGKFLAVAYLGNEKKSAGWVISRERGQMLTDELLLSLFQKAKDYRKT